MKILKKVIVAGFMICATALVFAQESETSETSVENEYLNDVDGDIITTLADSDDYENKFVALQYLEGAIESGNTSDSVIKALDKLAGEGLSNQARTNGRLVNNYPEIRRQACLLMAQVPTEHSKNTLVSIAVADSEPMVISAAVKSLGDIGINDNDEVVDAIAYANRRNQILNPTSSLAMEVLNAYEKLEPNTENKKIIIDSLARISTDYHYVTPVRQKAYKLLKKMSSSGSSDDSSKSSKSSDNTDEVDGE